MADCPKCGKKVSEKSDFCPKCGKRVKFSFNNKTLIVVGGIILVGIIIVILLANRAPSYQAPTLLDTPTYTQKESESQISKDVDLASLIPTTIMDSLGKCDYYTDYPAQLVKEWQITDVAGADCHGYDDARYQVSIFKTENPEKFYPEWFSALDIYAQTTKYYGDLKIIKWDYNLRDYYYLDYRWKKDNIFFSVSVQLGKDTSEFHKKTEDILYAVLKRCY